MALCLVVCVSKSWAVSESLNRGGSVHDVMLPTLGKQLVDLM